MTATDPRFSMLAVHGLNRRRLAVGAAIAAIAVLGVLGVLGWPEHHAGTGAGTRPGAAATRPTAVSGVVVIEGGPPPPPGSSTNGAQGDAHARIVVTGTTRAGIRLQRHFTADAHGRFALELPPGVYRVAAIIDSGAPLAAQPHRTITVTGGHAVRTRITIQAF
jgi:hypothetical protein